MFGRFGLPELGLILLIILIIFGAGRLPEVGGAIGRGLRAFRKAQKGEDKEADEPKPGEQSTGK